MKQIKFISCVLWLSHSYVNYGGFWIMHQLLQNIICILERTWNIGGGEISKVVTKSLSRKCWILPLNIRRGGQVQKYPSKETFRALASSVMDDSNLLSSYDKVSGNTACWFPKCYKKSDRSQDARRGSPDMPN